MFAASERGVCVLIAIALCALGSAWPVPAVRAQPATLPLAVPAADPQGCVAEPALRAHVDRFLRVHGPIDVEVVVHAGGAPLGFELRRDGAFVAERRFERLPIECSARLDALALAIAVAVENAVGPERASLDTSAIEDAQRTQAAASEAEPATGTPPSDSEPAAEPATPEAEAAPADAPADDDDDDDDAAAAADAAPSEPLLLTLAPFLGGGVLVEALLEPALALHAGAELRLGPTFAVSLAAMFAPGVEVELAGVPVTSALAGGRVLGCAGSAPRGLRFEGCAGAAAAAVWSSAERGGSLLEASDATNGWVAGVARVALSYPAEGRFGARLALDGHLNVVQPGVRLAADAPAQPVERVVGLPGLGASLELWLALP